jgi:hypothetical protein
MAMTARVKDELSRLTVTKPRCRKAEVATTLPLAGGLHIVGGRIVVEAEMDTAAAARRLRKPVIEGAITVPNRGGAEAFVDAADIGAVAVETLSTLTHGSAVRSQPASYPSTTP